jgi:hypothetical protein
LERLNRDSRWDDYNYAELEAKVEVQGSPRNLLAVLLRRATLRRRELSAIRR